MDMSLSRHFAIAGAVLVLMFIYAGTAGAADCGDNPSGIGYSTPEDCVSNCTNLCTSMTSCRNVSDPCDPDYPRDPNHPCDSCDPCRICRDDVISPCGEMTHTEYCDPCKRCSGKEIEFCFSRAGTPPPPPPVDPAPTITVCSKPYSGSKCKQTIFSNGNSSCFCTCS